MNPRLIRMIIALMFLAMTGLVGIQIYWIREAVEQREQQFKQSVFEAMSDVTIKYVRHRMEETANRLLSDEAFNEEMQRGLDSIASSYSEVRRSKDGKIEEITISVNRPGLVNGRFWTTRTYDGSIEDGAFVDPMGLGGPDGPNQFFPEYPAGEGNELEAIEQVMAHQELIGLLFREMILGYVSDFSDIDSNALDSMIQAELRAKGISTPYEFGVLDGYQNRMTISRTKRPEHLKHSNFRVLMPTSRLGEENYLLLFFPHKTQYLLQNIWFLLLASAFLIIIIIFSFAYTINIIFRQKKVQDIKNDLINNITHELKTPISTISLACQAMNDPDLANSPLRNNYVQMIDEENKRLGLLVENVLQSAVYEKGDFKLKIKKVDMHLRIDKALSSLSMQAKNKGIRLVRELDAADPLVEGDEVMITNLIFNMVDNAIKYYRPGDPYVIIRTRTEDERFILEIEDNGVGISKDNQKRIFEKLFRVPTGNVHNVKGYGLGLSYVKSIVERHHGQIEVESQLGMGSTFRIVLPREQHVFN